MHDELFLALHTATTYRLYCRKRSCEQGQTSSSVRRGEWWTISPTLPPCTWTTSKSWSWTRFVRLLVVVLFCPGVLHGFGDFNTDIAFHVRVYCVQYCAKTLRVCSSLWCPRLLLFLACGIRQRAVHGKNTLLACPCMTFVLSRFTSEALYLHHDSAQRPGATVVHRNIGLVVMHALVNVREVRLCFNLCLFRAYIATAVTRRYAV